MPALPYLCQLMEVQAVAVAWLGQKAYGPVWDEQERLLAANVAIKTAHYDAPPATRPTQHHLLLVEHPPVYTLGKSGKPEHLLISREAMAAQGIEYFKINRGGDITFHGPGQLVGYPILDLEKIYTDIGRYLRALEEVIIRTIGHYGLQGSRSPGETGVWLDPDVPGRERKICAMGVRCSRWITMHGWALNVNTPLHYFNNIIPCGIQNKQVTSMEKELGHPVDMAEVREVLLGYFAEEFGVALRCAG